MIPRVTWYGSKGSTVALKKREKGIGRGKKKKFTERGLQFPAETYTEYFKRRGGGWFSRAVDTSNSNAASKLCSKKISKQIMLFANRFIISENSSLFSFLPFPNHSSYFFSFSLTILFALKSREITLNPPSFSRLLLPLFPPFLFLLSAEEVSDSGKMGFSSSLPERPA